MPNIWRDCCIIYSQRRTNRFAEQKRLRDELKEAKSQLAERKLVDRDITFFVDSTQIAWNKEIGVAFLLWIRRCITFWMPIYAHFQDHCRNPNHVFISPN